MAHQDSEPWYAARMYARYWKHYSQAMHWLYRHKRAYRLAMVSLCSPPWYPMDAFQTTRYANWEGGDQSRRRVHSRSQNESVQSRRTRPCLKVSESKEKVTDMECEEGLGSEEEGIECDLSNMEISEELRQYFEETERHREERKRLQELEEQYIDADHDLSCGTRSTQPPSERPGERRKEGMKKLYGEDAAKIQGMETAIQLNFDRHCDKKQPKYWPIIPLKL